MQTKKVMIAFLGLVGISIWAPLMFDAFSDEPSPMDAYPDPTDDEAMEQPSSVLSLMPLNQMGIGAEGEPQADPDENIALPGSSSTAALLDALEVFRGTSAKVDLDSLIPLVPEWADVGQLQPQSKRVAPDLEEQHISVDVDEVEELLKAIQLSAIVRGTSGQWALIGGKICRPGDELVPGMIRIRSVEANYVQLETVGGPRRINLPALNTTPVAKPSSIGSSSATEPEGVQGSKTEDILQ